jgi:hypothetical protein
MEYCSAIKKNEIMLFEGKWMESEDIMLSEISQVQIIMFFLYTHLYIEHVCNSGTILGNLGGG